MTTLELHVLGGQRYELGEGARWIDGRLHYVDILAGHAYSWAGDGPRLEVASSEPLGAIAPVAGRADLLAVAEGMSITVAERGSGPEERIARSPLPGARAGLRVNDACVDPYGGLWVGAMPTEGAEPVGAVHRFGPDGPVTLRQGIVCPNGPAFTPDGRFFLADTTEYRIWTGRLGHDGRPHGFEPFATVHGGYPDGMTVDEEGTLWVAIWGAGRVDRYDTDGRLMHSIRLPASQPTSVCLMPWEGRQAAVITSARQGLADPGGEDGALMVVDVGVGAPPATAWVREEVVP
ncbi:SMP-30/gluconolactonase/LRE family protein [Amnibacterium sp. CER49]|uniref:SMP-30/gluconolactonase/LRE family protein n=1 Tax=Amnibacterium sp. CER49 TaxID=3039161 RepID=UPI0024499021|nr:SMP-30/gluconolactonase/LRE family protein [Amnibacterium sp. CER49]MDH2442847.1 SMP-30/gluconolactonase/LRE family protein [Amnibacterium sp. CER49]